jgi:hypothetical protein
MAWIIVFLIIFFLAVLLFFRVKLCVSYNSENDSDEEFQFQIRYLFITLRMNGQKTGKPKKAKKVSEKPEKSKKMDIAKLLKMLSRYSELLKNAASSTLKHMRIDRLFIKLIINEEDAAKTAILYGEACAVIYPAVSFLGGSIGVKKYEIILKPLFNGGNALAECACVISMRLGSILAVGIKQAVAFIIITVKHNNSNKLAKDGAAK